MNYDYLKNYAINYYLRYYPSSKKLEEKLLKKSKDDKILVKKILNEMQSLIVENQVIEAKIRFYIEKNKNLSYIKSKLFEKWFKKDDYENILKQKFDLDKSLLDKDYLRKKILDYKEKNKSKKYIFSKLCEREEDKENILEILDELFLYDWEFEILKKEYEKIINCHPELVLGSRNKIIEKLLRKWFTYDMIKKLK